MSDANESEGAESLPHELMAAMLIADPDPRGPSLRWTPVTVLIDLLEAVVNVLDGIAGFFTGQARSLAATASLKEELADREIRQRLKADERRRMQLHTLEDIAYLPEAQE